MSQTKEVTKVQIRPLSNRVVVRRLDAQEALKGGILLPDTAKKKQEQAEVVAIGPGKNDKNGKPIPVDNISIGDIVLIEKYSGQEITLDDQEFVIVRADDIIGVVE
ncbi:MAG: co-chaperone GroES [Chlamydiia bacterium]|nr:co-chaperone GroES [Chlamydiia bacterium]